MQERERGRAGERERERDSERETEKDRDSDRDREIYGEREDQDYPLDSAGATGWSDASLPPEKNLV